MRSTISTIFTGAVGSASSIVVSESFPPDPAQITSIMEIITQVIIAVATIWQLFRNSKK